MPEPIESFLGYHIFQTEETTALPQFYWTLPSGEVRGYWNKIAEARQDITDHYATKNAAAAPRETLAQAAVRLGLDDELLRDLDLISGEGWRSDDNDEESVKVLEAIKRYGDRRHFEGGYGKPAPTAVEDPHKGHAAGEGDAA